MQLIEVLKEVEQGKEVHTGSNIRISINELLNQYLLSFTLIDRIFGSTRGTATGIHSAKSVFTLTRDKLKSRDVHIKDELLNESFMCDPIISKSARIPKLSMASSYIVNRALCDGYTQVNTMVESKTITFLYNEAETIVIPLGHRISSDTFYTLRNLVRVDARKTKIEIAKKEVTAYVTN